MFFTFLIISLFIFCLNLQGQSNGDCGFTIDVVVTCDTMDNCLGSIDLNVSEIGGWTEDTYWELNGQGHNGSGYWDSLCAGSHTLTVWNGYNSVDCYQDFEYNVENEIFY